MVNTPIKHPEFEREHRLDVELTDFNKLGSSYAYYELENYIKVKKGTPKWLKKIP
jgi:hypothetical protein